MTESELIETRQLILPPNLYRQITKLHNRYDKTMTEQAFLVELLKRGIEALEADT